MVAQRTKVGSSPPLVYVEDRGGIYDAPLDMVWDFFLKDETYHPKAHRSTVRNFQERKLSDVSVFLSWEARAGRRWVKRACRMTTIPPALRVQEELNGPEAGSIKVYLYSPSGSRTRVDVLAYMTPRKLTRKQIRSQTRRVFANAYREDLPWFRKYVRSRKAT